MGYIFKVGKTYEAVDAFGYKLTAKVIARSSNFIITKCSYGDRKESYPLWNGENARQVTLVKCTTKTIGKGVEKTIVDYIEKTIDSSCLGTLSADKEAEIQEDENKEEIVSDDWIVGKEYEGICLKTKQRFKAVFVEDDGDDRDGYPLRFKLPFKDRESDTFNDYDNAAESCFDSDEIIIFKHGIKSILDWEEVKEERNPVCFEVGKEYFTSNGEMWECKAVFDANNRRVGVFYNKDTDVNIIPTIKTHNSVEYTLCGNLFNELNFIADEQYRDEIKAIL